MISIENVNLKIKDKWILQDINMSIPSGSIIGLVGRNGCGKTMLMKCICGFVNASTGVIKVNDKMIGKDIDFPEHLGIIIENPEFIPYYSGYKNLKILAEYRKQIGKKEIRAVMELVELNPDSKLPISKYSLGMKQRLGLAQAIMEKPSVLVLDEPFNGIDIDSLDTMRKIILSLKEEGATIILASHNQEDIQILCDKTYYMEKGKIIS